MTLSQTPARAICGMVTWPEPKTMALGGVAGGSMNAQLAANAAGMQSRSGFSPMAMAATASSGNRVAVVAVLDVTSVRNTTTVTTARSKSTVGRSPQAAMPLPIQVDRPEAPAAPARLKPPPNNSNTPHGSRLAQSQLRTPSIPPWAVFRRSAPGTRPAPRSWQCRRR